MTARSPLPAAAVLLVALAGCSEAAASLPALAVMAVLGAGLAVLRRRHSAAEGSRISVEARAALGRDAGIALVRVDGETMLVGWGRDGARLVRTMSRPGAAP